MSFTIGIRVAVKFRVFGFTFGSVDRSFSAGVDTAGKLSLGPWVGAASGVATTLMDERGVLVQVWV